MWHNASHLHITLTCSAVSSSLHYYSNEISLQISTYCSYWRSILEASLGKESKCFYKYECFYPSIIMQNKFVWNIFDFWKVYVMRIRLTLKISFQTCIIAKLINFNESWFKSHCKNDTLRFITVKKYFLYLFQVLFSL